MVVSMTGFGRGEVETDGCRASVELRSVNGRYGEVSVHLPRHLSPLENRIRDLVLSVLSRGHIRVSLNVAGDASGQGIPVLNERVFEGYRDGLARLQSRLGASGAPDPVQVALMPNVFEFESGAPDLDAVWKVVAPACEEAVAQCQSMRAAEGRQLAADLVRRIHLLRDLLVKIQELAPRQVEAMRKRLDEKLRELIAPENVDRNRLLTEIALLSERADITEETVRFHSHNEQFLKTLDREEPVGKRLNFLLQEMLREANTIGSKAGDAEIAHLVVGVKEEIEKLKEQVQNIE
ncbi:MAG: YicC family protein [Gemmatimonadota bacterium]|nr:YicC family protein [Gemmatimonadota bacterium]